ncbi:MAG: hypothetical protein HC906_01830 [Bacteroidales bacterium]|nr:hypothetical protein [Bacteroidales bacterium]
MRKGCFTLIIGLLIYFNSIAQHDNTNLSINKSGYFEMPGLNVMVFDDFYPEGHQGGLTIVQHGNRVAANGDLRLNDTPGQWQPIPKMKHKTTDTAGNHIWVNLVFPDSSRHRKGFNPIDYPDLYVNYTVHVKSEGKTVRLTVDLDRPMSSEWEQKVGFNLELYPVNLFGKSWICEEKTGIFPRQSAGPVRNGSDNEVQQVPYASGNKLTIAPESDEMRMTIESKGEPLNLFDGRINHNNGWFIVRSLVKPGVSKVLLNG